MSIRFATALLSNDRSTRVQAVRVFVAVSCFLGAFFAGRMVLADFNAARATSAWPTTTGMVTRVAVEPSDKIGKSFVRVAYDFTVDGQSYTGAGLRKREGPWLQQRVDELMAEVPVGQPHAVSYNPANPNESLLLPGADFQDYVQLAVIPGLAGFGIGLVVWVIRLHRRSPA